MVKTKVVRVMTATVLLAALVLGAFVLTEPAPDTRSLAAQARATLKAVRETRTVAVPADTSLSLPDVGDAAVRKTLFIAAMLPIIVAENTRIAEQRRRVQSLTPGSAGYGALAFGYGLPPDAPRERLLARIDIVPAALVLAQGAIESAWGTSRFAREGNAFFGMRSYQEDAAGLRPREATGFVVQSYPTPRQSVRRFMKTLNTHSAYAVFRKHRADLRKRDQRPTGLEMAPYLKPYSEIGQKYVHRIIQTIRTNGLERYEGLALKGP